MKSLKLNVYRKNVNDLTFKCLKTKFEFRKSSYYEDEDHSYIVEFEKCPCKSRDGKIIYRFKRYGESNTYLYLLLNPIEYVKFNVLQKAIRTKLKTIFLNIFKISASIKILA